MAHITFITGGQRSGKSSYAQRLVESKTTNPVYLATSRIWDEIHKQRIERHKKDRGEHWITIEEEKYLSKHNFTGKTVLIDCVTLWLNNFFFDNNNDVEKSLNEAKQEFQKLLITDANYVIVSNELGMGGFPIDPIQAKFTDLQGWTNQFIAQHANDVILMVSGLPLKIK